MREIIESVLSEAVWAPSGDNSQPWKFRVRDASVDVINVRIKDTSSYNYEQRASYLALGALIENVRVLCAARGFEAQLRLFPDGTTDTVARLMITKATQADKREDASLASCVRTRASNRRPYDLEMVPSSTLDMLAADGRKRGVEFRYITDRVKIGTVARAASINERVVLENRDLHAFLFEHVTWNARDDAERHGFYIDTFEFKAPQRLAFKLFSFWPLLRLFNTVGASRMVAKETEKSYRTAAAYCALVLPLPVPAEGYVRSGMALQRIWLRATSKTVALQITTGTPLLAQRVRDGDAGSLSRVHQKMLIGASESMEEAFGVRGNERLMCVFRTGFASPPTGRTSRFAPMVEFT